MSGLIHLRAIAASDIPTFFEQHLEGAAAPLGKDEREASLQDFERRWHEHMADPLMLVRAVIADGALAGYVAHFPQEGTPSISYWLGSDHWGRGIATRAVDLLLALVPTRPIFARVASDNPASLRVLEKCGFTIVDRRNDDGEILLVRD